MSTEVTLHNLMSRLPYNTANWWEYLAPSSIDADATPIRQKALQSQQQCKQAYSTALAYFSPHFSLGVKHRAYMPKGNYSSVTSTTCCNPFFHYLTKSGYVSSSLKWSKIFMQVNARMKSWFGLGVAYVTAFLHQSKPSVLVKELLQHSSTTTGERNS